MKPVEHKLIYQQVRGVEVSLEDKIYNNLWTEIEELFAAPPILNMNVNETLIEMELKGIV